MSVVKSYVQRGLQRCSLLLLRVFLFGSVIFNRLVLVLLVWSMVVYLVFQTPEFDIGLSRELVMPALNLAMVSFVSMMITARSFAAKNGYDIDADKEFRALGMINIASAFSQGFVVSGTSSRTAVNDANGGKTQLVSIISAVIIAIVAVIAYQPLQFIPVAALGVVLIVASISLIDLKGIWGLRKRDKDAFYLSSITFIAVLVIGVIPGYHFGSITWIISILANSHAPNRPNFRVGCERNRKKFRRIRQSKSDSRSDYLPL